MKKYILLFCIFLSAFPIVRAQQKRVIKETFESNKMQWDEFYERSCSAGVGDGKLVIKSEDRDTLIRSVADFPIEVDRDFCLKFDLSIKKINSSDWFGIMFNYEDENNYNCFLVKEKQFKVVNKVNGKKSISRQGGAILKPSKKEQKINIVMERKSGKLIFSVNNIEVISFKKRLETSTFGCCVSGENELNVEEVIIEQLEGNSN